MIVCQIACEKNHAPIASAMWSNLHFHNCIITDSEGMYLFVQVEKLLASQFYWFPI